MLSMAPRRNCTNSNVHQQELLLPTDFHNEMYCLLDEADTINIKNTMPPMQTSSLNNNQNNQNNCSMQDNEFTRCCMPNGDCLKLNARIHIPDVFECIRVLCNNENCNAGQFMHRECFETWEQSVLIAMKSIGRARSWSDRQRAQNLWTKKGFDLVYKACGCNCGRGQIRKDLAWSAQVNTFDFKNTCSSNYINGFSGQKIIVNGSCPDDPEVNNKKKKKRNRNNQKNGLLLPINATNYSGNPTQEHLTSQQTKKIEEKNTSCNNAILSVQLNTSKGYAVDNSFSTNDTNISFNTNVGVIGSGLQNIFHQHVQHHNSNIISPLKRNVISLTNEHIGNVLGLDLSARSSSFSTVGSEISTHSDSHSSDISVSSIHPCQQHTQHGLLHQQYEQKGIAKNLFKGITNGLASSTNIGPQLLHVTKEEQASVNTNGFLHLPCLAQQQLVQQQKNKEVEIYSQRVRSSSGCNGIFSRRLDFSSFNLLPKTRLNSYQVKIEDEGNHGNDETRLFILSSLAQSQMSRVACILCENSMLVFDRYPLVDGSFFLSPKQHSPGCIEVKYDGRVLFLTCVCMTCLDGTATNRPISCRFCCENWDGSNLVLGTMYAYDIFAAMPCCTERLKCNKCYKLLLHPQQRLNFYSDYSHCVTCPYCTTQDTHFVKSLTYCYTTSIITHKQLIA